MNASLTSNRQVTSGLGRSKNVPSSTCVRPSIAVIQISNDQLSFFNQILCTGQKLYALKLPFHDWGRISSDRAIKCSISSLISCLLCWRQHHSWSRYRFSRPSRWPRHAFWPRVSSISLFSFRSCGTRHSCFFRIFQVVPWDLEDLYLPFLLSVLQDPLFLFFQIFQGVPWDLEDLSFPLVPSCHVVPSLQWDQDIRGDLQDRPSHLTYSTWWA